MRVSLLLLVLVSIVLVSCANLFPLLSVSREESDTFTVHVSSDGTSSGATRISEYNLSYREGKLIQGSFYGLIHSGTERISEKCTYDTEFSNWMPISDGDCLLDVPLTTDGVYEKINSGEWKTECSHYTTCVKFIED